MLATMHNANALDQLATGDYAAMAALNDRVHANVGPRTHRRLGRGPHFLPASGSPGHGTLGSKRGEIKRRRPERQPLSRPATSSLPAPAWAALVITGARQIAGREQAVVPGIEADIC